MPTTPSTTATRASTSASTSEVLVDFSAPGALEFNLDAAIHAAIPIVIGTTGLEERHHWLIDSAAVSIPVLQTGKDNAASMGASAFDGKAGFAIGYARRVNDSASINVALATSKSETVVRGGVNLAW